MPQLSARRQRAAEWALLANLTPEQLRARLAELEQELPPESYARCLEGVRLFAGIFTDPRPQTPEQADAVETIRRLAPGMAHSMVVVAAELDAAGES